MPPLLPLRGDRPTSLLYNHTSANIQINVLFVFLIILEDYIVFAHFGPRRIQKRGQILSSPLDDAAVQRSNQVHLDTITTSFPLSNFHSSALRSRSPWPLVSLPSFSGFSSHYLPLSGTISHLMHHHWPFYSLYNLFEISRC